MKKNYTIAAILLGVLAVVLLFYFFIMPDDKEEQGRQYHWKTNFKANSDHPYGTQFIKELLRSYRPGEPFVFSAKKPLHLLLDSAIQTGAPTDYIFIGEIIFLEDKDRDALLQFMSAGNDVFMAASRLPFDLVDTVFQYRECDREIFLSTKDTSQVTMNLYHPSLHTEKGYTYTFRDGESTYSYPWGYFNDEIFCDSVRSTIPVGYQNPDHVNFIRIPYGYGNLYLHSAPLVFTNYFISKPDKATYAADVFSHLKGKGIIWDEFSKASFAGGDDDAYNSPLSYILQHESLKYGWWMMLAAVLLYTLFTAKRKQRVIPVLEEKVNTTLEFVKIVSALHFQNGNHLDIAKKKMKYFLYFIRAKYGMHTQHFTDEHIKRLSERSKVDVNDLRIIFNEYQTIERSPYQTPGADRLITLYNAIDHFYKHCK